MVIKSKAVTKLVQAASRASSSKVEVEGQDALEETMKTMKRPAAAAIIEEAEDEVPEDTGAAEEENEDEDEEMEEEISEEEKLKKEEEETQLARRKELKGMYIDELKELASKAGLFLKVKQDIIDGLVKLEAKVRAEERAHAAKIRSVVMSKQGEYEAKSISELKKLCDAADIKGAVSKQDRIQCLLKHWQDNDGIDKGLADIAYNEKKADLVAMEKNALFILCKKKGVDPYLKEVMVDRVVKQEAQAGRFRRPTSQDEAEVPTSGTPAPGTPAPSMVDQLLANESIRKKEKELKKQQEEATSKKRKELSAMSIDELKKGLVKRKMDATGKKEALVEALFAVSVAEEARAAHKAKLQAMAIIELKELVLSKQLPVSRKKDDMVEAVLAYEDKCRTEALEFEAKVDDVLKKKREELANKSAGELKDLCASKKLKPGVSKEDRLSALLQFAKDCGEVDGILATMARNARREQLLVMDNMLLSKLCADMSVDPLVKEIMVERLLEHDEVEEPACKKARSQ